MTDEIYVNIQTDRDMGFVVPITTKKDGTQTDAFLKRKHTCDEWATQRG